MTPREFRFYMKGALAYLKEAPPDAAQWKIIVEAIDQIDYEAGEGSPVKLIDIVERSSSASIKTLS